MDGVGDLTPLLGQMAQVDRYLQPTPEQLAEERRQRLQLFFASLIGARKGEEWQRVGEGAVNALLMPGAQARGRDEARAAKLQTLAQMMQLNAQLQQQQQAAQRAQIESGVPIDIGAPRTVQGPPEAFQAPGGAAGLAGAATGSPAGPPSTLPTLQPGPPGDLKAAMKQRYVALARDALAARPPRPDLANEYMKAAAALEVTPEYYGAPEFVMKGDQPVALQMGKNAPPRELAGYAPPPKWELKQLPGGGASWFNAAAARPQAGEAYAPQMTLAEAAAAAARAQELGISGANLVLAKQRLGLEQQRLGMDQAAAEAGRWQYDPARGMSVNAITGQARDVMAGGQPIGVKPKEPDVQQIRAGALLQQMQDASAAHEKLGPEPTTVLGRRAEEIGQAQARSTLPYGLGALVRSRAPEKSQVQNQIETQWATAAGAAFSRQGQPTPEAIARIKEDYFPQPGDGPEVRQRKAAARISTERAIASIRDGSSATAPAQIIKALGESTSAPKADPLGIR